jgi:hypothetical protein
MTRTSLELQTRKVLQKFLTEIVKNNFDGVSDGFSYANAVKELVVIMKDLDGSNATEKDLEAIKKCREVLDKVYHFHH